MSKACPLTQKTSIFCTTAKLVRQRTQRVLYYYEHTSYLTLPSRIMNDLRLFCTFESKKTRWNWVETRKSKNEYPIFYNRTMSLVQCIKQRSQECNPVYVSQIFCDTHRSPVQFPCRYSVTLLCVAEAAVTEGIRHHFSQLSCYLESKLADIHSDRRSHVSIYLNR